MSNIPKQISRGLAYGLSVLLYPLFTPTYLMVTFCVLFNNLRQPLPPQYWWFAIGGTFFFTCLVPLIILIVMKMQGRITDFDISDHRQRLVPLLYAIISFSFWCAYLYSVLKVPDFMFWTAVSSVVALAVCAVISNYWKISAHLASMGGVVGMVLGYLFYFGINAPGTVCGLLLLSLLLMYARIFLEAHTPLQVVLGYLLGLVFTLIPNFIIFYA